MRKNIISIIAIFIGIITFTGCSNNDEFFTEDENKETVTPGVYSTDLVVSSNEGGKIENATTRGLDTENGQFTNEYPYDYIYLHRADDLTGEDHKSIRIPLDRNVDYCDSCKAIHLEVEVLDGETGGYIIRAGNEEMSLSDEDEVYFSTIPDTYWTSDIATETPHGYVTFFQTEGINTELLRSTSNGIYSDDDTYVPSNYTKQQLIELITSGTPQISMTRHCTAFRVALMFTTNFYGSYQIMNEQHWLEVMGHDEFYSVNNFYIKLYLGPNFCHRYNLEKNTVPSDDQGGFYVTNRNNYQQFGRSDYAFEGGGSNLWSGYGYETDDDNFLIAPLNKNSNLGAFSLYVYIKHYPTGQTPDLISDEGSVWLEIPVKDFKLIANRVHYISITLNAEELKDAFPKNTILTQTRAFEAPKKIEVKPLKIIHEEKPF